MIDQYTKVLESVAETGDEQSAQVAVSKLILHLKSTGRMKMLPTIARELRKIGARRRALMPRVEVASEKNKGKALLEAKEAGIEAKDVQVNHSLISGWRGMHAGVLVDRSGKQALVAIYRKVIS